MKQELGFVNLFTGATSNVIIQNLQQAPECYVFIYTPKNGNELSRFPIEQSRENFYFIHVLGELSFILGIIHVFWMVVRSRKMLLLPLTIDAAST